MTALRLGTRGSALALAQARLVESALRAAWPELEIEIVTITTQGDVRTDVPLSAIGGVGVFAAELERALRDGRVDFAVHSAKDLPSTTPNDLVLAAFPRREDPRDVVVSRDGRSLEALSHGATVGTSSPRRACQVRAARPDVTLADIRGNVDTRLRKLDAGEYDAIVLAAAGLNRLGLQHRITQYLDPSVMLPAVSQGAIAIEARADDADTIARVAALDHAETRVAVTAERAFLARLGAGCTAPTGAHARLLGEGCKAMLHVEGMLGMTNGSIVRASCTGVPADAAAIGLAVAEVVIADAV